MTSSGMLESARRAFDGRAWAEAYDRLTAAAAQTPLDCDDLERLATAAYLAGHDKESTDAWTRAHHAYRDRDEPEQAVRCAFWLAFGLLQRGEMAQGGGWLARARRLVEEHGLDCVEQGYLLIPDGLMAMGGGDYAAAHARFEEVSAVARRFGDDDLVTFGTLGRGQTLLRMGRRTQGLSLFDEAMVSVTAGEISPVVSGIVYCAVIEECRQSFDVHRAQEWTVALNRWCNAQPGLVPYRGQCLVHRSQLLQLHGAWGEAMVEARQARDRLAEPPHSAIGMAHYQLGELHRLRGELDAAEGAYRRAHECGRQPQPGLALLRLAQHRVDAATAAIDRALSDAHDPVGRVMLLPAYVEIMLSAERVADARAAADELERLAAGTDAALLRATADHSRGAVLLAEGDPKAALQVLRDAWQAWQELEAPYEAGQACMLLAVACRTVGDHDSAELECDAARAAFEALGATPALDRLEELCGAPRPHHPDLPITAREVQVLRLVATGRTNREIAEALVISEKTVERHLSNIFAKAGVANRAAATAYAYQHDLV